MTWHQSATASSTEAFIACPQCSHTIQEHRGCCGFCHGRRGASRSIHPDCDCNFTPADIRFLLTGELHEVLGGKRAFDEGSQSPK